MLVSNSILLTVIATDTTNNFYVFVSFPIIVCVFHVLRKQQTHAKPLWIRIPSSAVVFLWCLWILCGIVLGIGVFSESETVAAFNKLIHQDRVPIILGVWTSHVERSVFPIAQETALSLLAESLLLLA